MKHHTGRDWTRPGAWNKFTGTSPCPSPRLLKSYATRFKRGRTPRSVLDQLIRGDATRGC